MLLRSTPVFIMALMVGLRFQVGILCVERCYSDNGASDLAHKECIM